MLTTPITQKMIEEWKRIFEIYRFLIKANRKTGAEIDAYFRKKYPYQKFNDVKFKDVVAFNIVENEHSCNKLPLGVRPNINCYRVGDVLIGIYISSGEFHVECEHIEKAIPIYDDLFVYRGLDENDLKNYIMIAQYVNLTQKFH